MCYSDTYNNLEPHPVCTYTIQLWNYESKDTLSKFPKCIVSMHATIYLILLLLHLTNGISDMGFALAPGISNTYLLKQFTTLV